MKKFWSVLSTMNLCALSCNLSYAGSFSLYTEGSVVALGDYAAGIAAEGYDASIGWYNPAGLVLLSHEQAVVGGVGVFPESSLTGTSTYNTTIPGIGALPPYNQTFTNVSGSRNALVPSLHYAKPLNSSSDVVFGLSIVAPFGLSTDYDVNSPVRYAATFSKLETIDVSPEIGGLLTKNLSFGLGLDLEYAKVNFNSVIGSPALMTYFDVPANTLDSQSNNKGSSFGVGFHTGLLLMTDSRDSRLGLNYQSRVWQQFEGSSLLKGPLADPNAIIADPLAANPSATYTSNGLISNGIYFPDIVTLSAYQKIFPKTALLGSLVYTNWSLFNKIELSNVAVGLASSLSSPLTQTVTSTSLNENYRDTWRFALGLVQTINEKFNFRFGGGYDQTPTINSERDVRLPDTDRVALSAGLHWQILKKLGIDFGYTHLFAVNVKGINKNLAIGTTSTETINASIKANANLVGLQAVWTMD